MNETMNRDNAKQIEFYGNTLDECVEALLKYQKRGESVVVNFNGHNLYSCDVTLDSAYQEVLGVSKEESDRLEAEWREEYRREQKEKEEKAKAKVPEWISRGEALIYPERAEEWKKCVNARVNDLYQGADLDDALEIMEKLESGATLDEAKDMLERQDHSGASYGMVRNIILSFSKQGPEFWEHTATGEISPKTRRILDEKKRENAAYKTLSTIKGLEVIPTELNEDIAKVILDNFETSQTWIEGDFAEKIAGVNIENRPGTDHKPTFQVRYDEKGDIQLREFFAMRHEPLRLSVDLSKIDIRDLITYGIEAMESHLNAGNFDSVLNSSKKLRGESLENHLKQSINLMRELEQKVPNQEVNTEFASGELESDQEEISEAILKEKAAAIEVDFSWKYGNTLDAAVQELEEYKARGESVVIDFNGHKLYSCDITIDGAYKEVLGQTKAEHDAAMEEWRKEYEEKTAREEEEARRKVPEWISRGEGLIYPERAKEWQKCVNARVNDLYQGAELDDALEIMEKLESGATLDEAKDMLERQDHTGASYGLVRNIVLSFSKQGPEFWEHTATGEISSEDRRFLDEKKKENRRLEKIHEKDSTRKVSKERKQEEAEIVEGLGKKGGLAKAIASIEQQIKALKERRATLKRDREGDTKKEFGEE